MQDYDVIARFDFSYLQFRSMGFDLRGVLV